jgi:hypothetical protein
MTSGETIKYAISPSPGGSERCVAAASAGCVRVPTDGWHGKRVLQRWR